MWNFDWFLWRHQGSQHKTGRLLLERKISEFIQLWLPKNFRKSSVWAGSSLEAQRGGGLNVQPHCPLPVTSRFMSLWNALRPLLFQAKINQIHAGQNAARWTLLLFWFSVKLNNSELSWCQQRCWGQSFLMCHCETHTLLRGLCLNVIGWLETCSPRQLLPQY